MSRPKRESAQRAAAFILQSQTSVLFWNEERDLKKALHASLVEARRKARIAVKDVSQQHNTASTSQRKSKSKTKMVKEKKMESPVAALSNFSMSSSPKEKTREKVAKIDETENSLNCLKKPRIPAQRKFAQGSSNNTPVSTPIKVGYCVPTVTQEVFTKFRPTTEDFLTFLCFRDTDILPQNLDLETLNRTVGNKSKESQIDVVKDSEKKATVLTDSGTTTTSQQPDNKNLNTKLDILKAKYKLQRLVKNTINVSNARKMNDKITANKEVTSKPSKSLTKKLDNTTIKAEVPSKKKKEVNGITGKTKRNDSKNISTSTQRVLRSYQSPSDEGTSKSSLSPVHCLCKSEVTPRSAGRPLKKVKGSCSPILGGRVHERKAKPKGLVDYHLEIDDFSDSEHLLTRKPTKVCKRDYSSLPPATKKDQKLPKKDKNDPLKELSVRVLRNRHLSPLQSESCVKSPFKSVNKNETKSPPPSAKKAKTASSPETRPSRKAKPSVPLIDYHFEIEGESDGEVKLSSKKEKDVKESGGTKVTPVKKLEPLKSPSVVLTRTQIPVLQQHLKTLGVKSVQKTEKSAISKNKVKAKLQPDKRVTRSLSNASKKEEEAAKERERDIQKKILEVERRQKQKMSRHPSDCSLHSSSSSNSLPSSMSSSSSINIPRITRSLEQLKKLRKEFKKNKQKLLNGNLVEKSCKQEKQSLRGKKSLKKQKVVQVRSLVDKSTSTPKSKAKLTKPKAKLSRGNLKANRVGNRKKSNEQESTGDDITKTLQTMVEGLNSSDDHCVADLVYCDSAPIQGLITREFSGAFAEETVTTAGAMLLPSSSSSTSSFAQTCSPFYAQTGDLCSHKATVDASTNTTEEEMLAFSVEAHEMDTSVNCQTEELSVGTQTMTPVGSPKSEFTDECTRVEAVTVERKSSSRMRKGGVKL